MERRNRANRINKAVLASYESRITSNAKWDNKSFFRYVRCEGMNVECKLCRKATGTLKNIYFGTRVVNLWNKLDEETI